VEEVDAALDRPRRERVPAVVDPAMLDARRTQGVRPLPVSESLDVDVAAARRWEDG
jgi:hypothetical protein